MPCPARSSKAAITAIEPQVDASTRNFKVAGHASQPGRRAAPGQFAQVGFDTGRRAQRGRDPADRGQLQPLRQRGVRDQQDRRASRARRTCRARPLTGDKLIVKQRFVKTGATRGDLIAVTEGLKPGEQVVTSGLLKLRNDAEVTINNKMQPAADAHPTPENR